ncbi:MAG TPA: secretin N-terminal domain-containing protein [Planctomycetota bacterium]|nr:secretin N-terminal domain-containing protein [Planctomycetota bacterium]
MHFKYASVLVGIIVLILSIPIVAQIPEKHTVRDEFISFDVHDKPFSEIIEAIIAQTGKNIIYDDAIKEVFVTAKISGLVWRQALDVIAKEYKCILEDVGNNVLKVSKPPTVTMEFEGADIRAVINQIATISDRNIVISEQVKGLVSLRLKDVPWEEALESIIKTKNYVLVKESGGRILRVVPPQEIQTQLETKIFKLRYIRPKSVYTAYMKSNYFKESKGMALGKDDTVQISNFSLLSALQTVCTPGRGRITYDDMTNTLVITDTKPQIDKMEEIIREIDREPKQVFLDVKFIRTTNSDLFDFGLGPNDNGLNISQSFGSISTRMPFSLGSSGWEDAVAAYPEHTKGGFPNDELMKKITDDIVPISFGKMDFSQTNFTLKLLKKDMKTKVVQAPKIITLDHHEATIFVGRSISYIEIEMNENDNGTITYELSEAQDSPVQEGFQMLVLPHVIPDTNKIQLTMITSNDQLSGTTAVGNHNGLAGFNRFSISGKEDSVYLDMPEITQQVLVTHMILESGQTAVLGGLLKVSQQETVRKIPFLGDIPFFGYLFKSKNVSKEKEDMFIFVTPRLVQSAEDADEKLKATVADKVKSQRSRFESIWEEEK